MQIEKFIVCINTDYFTKLAIADLKLKYQVKLDRQNMRMWMLKRLPHELNYL